MLNPLKCTNEAIDQEVFEIINVFLDFKGRCRNLVYNYSYYYSDHHEGCVWILRTFQEYFTDVEQAVDNHEEGNVRTWEKTINLPQEDFSLPAHEPI